MISAIIKGLDLLLELGRSLGSALRRKINKTKC